MTQELETGNSPSSECNRHKHEIRGIKCSTQLENKGRWAVHNNEVIIEPVQVCRESKERPGIAC